MVPPSPCAAPRDAPSSLSIINLVQIHCASSYNDIDIALQHNTQGAMCMHLEGWSLTRLLEKTYRKTTPTSHYKRHKLHTVPFCALNTAVQHLVTLSCLAVNEHSTGICLKNKNTNTEKFRLTIIPMRTLNPIKHVAASHSVQPITLQRRRQGWGGGGERGGFSPPQIFAVEL